MQRRKWIRLGFGLAVVLLTIVRVAYCQDGFQVRLGPPCSPDVQEIVPANFLALPGTDTTITNATPNKPQETGLLTASHRQLTLSRVLLSVERHYPLLLAKLQERDIAQGKLLSSFGEFDLKATGNHWANQGSFDNHRYRLSLEQAFGHHGIRAFAGHRRGRGLYPSYYQDRLTAEGGEIFAGARFPLLRDRAIDPARAALAKTQIGVELAEPDIAAARLQFLRLASRAFWSWVATAQRYRIAGHLLEIAEKRDEFLRKRFKAGAVARIEIVDNQRTIVDRRTRLLLFKRAFEQTSIHLSLFLRDDYGKPVRPDCHWIASDFPTPHKPNPHKLAEDGKIAWKNRPELHTLQLTRQQLQVELSLAKNRTLPNLDFIVKGAQDFGKGKKALDRSAYEAGLHLELPFQRSLARGKILTTHGRLAKLCARERFARDQIAAELQNAMSALVRFYQMYHLAIQNVEVNRTMEEAEVRKYKLGKSNMLFVNLRELARAEAQFQEVDALVQYYQALADYHAALGIIPAKSSKILERSRARYNHMQSDIVNLPN